MVVRSSRCCSDWILPATVQRAGVLPVLGSSLPYVVASELEHLDLLDAEAPLAQARDAFHAFWQNLSKLRCAGLCLDTALNLQEVYVNGAITHHLRARLVARAWCEAWDEALLSFWQLEMQRDLAPHQRWQFTCRGTSRGPGLSLRNSAGFLGSWELCFHDVASAVGLSSAEAVRARLPANITAAEAALRAVDVTYSFDWESCHAQSHPKG